MYVKGFVKDKALYEYLFVFGVIGLCGIFVFIRSRMERIINLVTFFDGISYGGI